MLQIQLLPFPTLQTERLWLREITEADAPEILRLRSDSRTMQYIGREKPKTEADALTFIRQIQQALQDNLGITWGLCTLANSQLIGTLGFWRMVPDHHRAEIGYMLHPDYWQQGLISEALAKTLEYGFRTLHLHSVEANVHPDNVGSVRLLEKHGFVREGYFRENYLVRGTFQDTASYSLLNPNPD